jgi:hypothetical protein
MAEVSVGGTDRNATHPTSVASADREPNRWAVLALLSVPQLVVVLDATIVTIAIPSARRRWASPPRTGSGSSPPTRTVAKYGTWPTGISCVAADWCTLVGGYNTVKRLEQAVGVPLAEHWNGRRWSVQHVPAYSLYFPALSSVSCVSRSSCLAAGTHYLNQQGTPSPFAERWNGRRWTAATAGLSKYGSLNSVSCLSIIDCVAVGQFDPAVFAGPEPTEPVVERWNGARWRRLAVPKTPAPPPVDGYFDKLDPSLVGISCIPPTGCVAVGDQADGSERTPLARPTRAPLAPPQRRLHETRLPCALHSDP